MAADAEPAHSFLSHRVRRTLRNFIRAVLPADEFYSKDLEDRVLAHCCETMHYVPATAQLPFRIGLWSLEFGSFVMGTGFERFSKLSLQRQRTYVGRWAHNPVFLFRDFFKALKGFVMLAYYEQPELMNSLDYDPQSYIDELKANDSYHRD